MDVRATLLWRLSQLCSSLRDNPFHCSALPCAYYLPHRKVAWEGYEKIAVSLKADAFCWPEARGSLELYLLLTQAWLFMNVVMRAIPHAFHPAQPLCVFFIGSKLQTEHLFSLQVACNCLPGYSGDGVSQCNPINLCEQVCLHFAVSRGEGHSLEAFLSPNS